MNCTSSILLCYEIIFGETVTVLNHRYHIQCRTLFMALSTLLIKLHTAVHCTDSRQMTGVALHSSVGVVKNVYSLVV